MPSYSLPSLGRPTQSGGFASGIDDAAYPNLWDGLVGAWSPELGWTGPTLIDRSGNGYHGTLDSGIIPDIEQGTNIGGGNGARLINIADYAGGVEAPLLLEAYKNSVKRGFSTVSWTKNTGSAAFAATLVLSSSTTASNNYSLNRWAGTNTFRYQHRVPSTGGYCESTSGVSGKLNCFTAVVEPGDTGEFHLWTNGANRVDTTAASSTSPSNLDNFHCSIGGWRPDDGDTNLYTSQHYIGTQLVYNRPLDDYEIQLLSNYPLIYLEKAAPTRTSLSVPGVPYSFSGARVVQGAGSNSAVEVKPTPSSYARTKEESAYPNLWEGLTNFQSPNLKPDALKVHDIVGNVTMETTATQDLGVDGGKFGIQSISSGSTPSQQRVGDAVNFWSTGKFTCAMNFTWGGTNWVSFRNMMWVRDEFGENVVLIRSSNSSGVINVRSSDSAGTDVVNLSLPIIQAGENVTVGLAADFPAGVVTIFLYCHSQGYYQFYDTSLGTGLGPAGDINATSTWNGYTTSGNIDATYHGFAAWNRTLSEREILQLCRNFEAPFAPSPNLVALPAAVTSVPQARILPAPLTVTTKPEPSLHGGYANCAAKAERPDHYPVFASVPEMGNPGANLRDIITGQASTRTGNPTNEHYAYDYGIGNYHQFRLDRPSGNERDFVEGNFSAACWVRLPIGGLSTNGYLFSLCSSTSEIRYVAIYIDANENPVAAHRNSATTTLTDTNTDITDRKWHLIGLEITPSNEVFTNGEMKLFVDGKYVSNIEISSGHYDPATYPTDQIGVGVLDRPTTDNPFLGLVGACYIWDRTDLDWEWLYSSHTQPMRTSEVPLFFPDPKRVLVPINPVTQLTSGYASATGTNTTATSIEDVPGLQTDVYLKDTGHIVAYLSAAGSCSNVNREGYWAISINGTDSQVLTRFYKTADDIGCAFVTYRTASPLSKGTYTVKARWYTEASTTLTLDRGQLLAVGLVDDDGDQVPSTYDEVANDTTTSGTLEDIDGLSQSLTMSRQDRIFGAMAASVSCSTNSETVSIANVIGTDLVATRTRTLGNSNDIANISATGISIYKDPTSYTIKGKHSTTGGTLTGSYNQSTFAMEVSSTKYLPNEYAHIGTGFPVASDTTTSTTLEPIDGLEATIVTGGQAYIVAILDLSISNSSANTQASLAIEIEGVDSTVILRDTGSAGSLGACAVVFRSETPLPAGPHTVKGLWATDTGTLTTTEAELSIIALETDIILHEIALPVVADLATPTTVSLASESDSALSATPVKQVVLGLASETDTALAVTITTPVGLSTETDSALAVTSLKTLAIGVALETDSALSITKAISIGLSSETDTGLALTSLKVKAIGLSSETDTALNVSPGEQHVVGLSTETDSALTLSSTKVKSVGIATETDSGLSITAGVIVSVGIATETDTGLSVDPLEQHVVGISTETDSALSTIPLRTISAGIALETDTALTITHSLGVNVGTALETDSGLSLSSTKIKSIGLATETDSALTVSSGLQQTLSVASETDTALSLSSTKVKGIGLATESDSALATTAEKSKQVGISSETDSALSTTTVKTIAVGITTETDSALSVSPVQSISVGIATETDTALGISKTKLKALGLATETDSGLGTSPLLGTKVINVGLSTETDSGLSISFTSRVAIGVATEANSARSVTQPVVEIKETLFVTKTFRTWLRR